MVNWSGGASGVSSGSSVGSTIGGGWGAVAGGIIGGAAGLFSSKGSNSSEKAAAQQYLYQRLLNEQAYELTQRGYRESPLNQRFGYESAGINPIFAMSNGASFGSYSGGSATGFQDSKTAEMGSMITNAYKAFQLERNKTNAEILGINAGIKNTNADTALKAEQTMTEKSKQIQMDFQNAMIDVQTHLAKKDLDTYDRRFYSNLYEQFQRAENYRASASLAEYNAETARISAEANAYETNYRENHPIYNWADRWASVAGRVFGGAGAAVNAYNSTKPVITENVKFGSNADYRGHTRTTRRRGK